MPGYRRRPTNALPWTGVTAVPAPAPAVLAVASGKGGVGKSTVALNLAVTLASLGHRVGLVDADVYGPDIPLMLGVTRRAPARSVSLARRTGIRRNPFEAHGVKVMSSQFLVAENQAIAWDRHLVDLLLAGFFTDTQWGELDVMIVDLPPGTADLQQRLARDMPLTGAIVVVTPQDVAHLDAKKVLTMFRQIGLAVLGGVENMATLSCPTCATAIDVFPPVAEERSIWHDGVERLVSIPLDPVVAAAAERGVPIVVSRPDGLEAEAFRSLAVRLVHP